MTSLHSPGSQPCPTLSIAEELFPVPETEKERKENDLKTVLISVYINHYVNINYIDIYVNR